MYELRSKLASLFVQAGVLVQAKIFLLNTKFVIFLYITDSKCFIVQAPCLAHEYKTWLERPAKDRHSCL
jgi:hypothetical protein